MRILLIDDRHLVRQGVRSLLTALPAAEILEASNAAEALSQFRKGEPHVVVLSGALSGTSSTQLLRRLLKEPKPARVLILGQAPDALFAFRVLQAGACGFISTYASAGELVGAINRLSSGKKFVDKDVATVLAQKAVTGETDTLEKLSLRELEIIRLLGQGLSMKAIALHLGIAYKTVANACSALKSKLGVKRTADLIRIAIELESES